MMPSSSGGGSSGGHFSGGGHSSGSTHGGHFAGSAGGFNRNINVHQPTRRPMVSPLRPRVVLFMGRRVYISRERAGVTRALWSIWGIALFFVAIVAMIWGATASELRTIRTDYEFYQQIATRAQADNDYCVQAKFVTFERYKNTDMYCIFYQFTANDGINEGYSYYVYNGDAIAKFVDDGYVMVALHTKKNQATALTQSVPLDFANAQLTDDAEYLDRQSSIKTCKMLCLIGAGVAGALLVGVFLVRMTAHTANVDQMAEANAAAEVANKERAERGELKDVPFGMWRCPYCDTLNQIEHANCSGCGATRQ